MGAKWADINEIRAKLYERSWQIEMLCAEPIGQKCIPMLQELKFQVSTAVLTVITVAAIVAAVLNFSQLGEVPLLMMGQPDLTTKRAVIAFTGRRGGRQRENALRSATGDVL